METVITRFRVSTFDSFWSTGRRGLQAFFLDRIDANPWATRRGPLANPRRSPSSLRSPRERGSGREREREREAGKVQGGGTGSGTIEFRVSKFNFKFGRIIVWSRPFLPPEEGAGDSRSLSPGPLGSGLRQLCHRVGPAICDVALDS